MKNKFYHPGLILITLVIIFSGCSKGFLDKQPLAKLSDNNVFASEDGALKALNAVYSVLQHNDGFDGQMVLLTEHVSDDLSAQSDFANANGRDAVAGYVFSPQDVCFNAVWKELYSGIVAANLITDKQELMTFSPTLSKRIVGEAKFLRAFYYFHLVNLFGGVPVFAKTLDFENVNIPRNTVQEVYAQIEKDLTEAAIDLPLKSEYASSDAGRATKGAAQALLAKAYLFQKKYQLAADMGLVVENSEQYQLMTKYRDNFTEEFNNNIESIFEIQNTSASGLAYDDAQGSWLPKWAKPNNIQYTAGPATENGWGTIIPSDDAIAAFSPGDKRRTATISVENQVLEYGWVCPSAGKPLKMWAPTLNPPIHWSNFGLHQRLFRFADVILIRAEALAELGDIEGAATELNKIRTRAGLAATSATTKADMIEAVRKDRRLELMYEFHRLYDLRRWGIVGPTLRAMGKTRVTDNRHELFPIPQEQIDVSQGVLKQNPGYN